MNLAYERITLKAHPIKVAELLKAPQFFEGQHIIAFELTENHMKIVTKFAKAHVGELTNVHLTMRPYSDDWSVEAVHFMFLVRDRIAADQNDTTRENKDSIYHGAMLDCGFVDSISGERQSIHDLGRRELWILTEYLMSQAISMGIDLSDLENMKTELKEGVGNG